MKKLALLILAIAMAASLSVVSSAHDGQTCAVWGTPAIDGDMEDLWQTAQYIDVADVAIGDLGDKTATAKVYSLWDGSYVYFYAVITDPVIDAELKDDAWNQDAIGFMIDYSYTRDKPGESYRDLGDASYAGYVNVPAIEGTANYPEQPSIFGIAKYAAGVQSYCKITPTGYNVEIRLPLLYKTYAAGDNLGYEICVNNGVGDGERAGQCVWKQANDAVGNESWEYSYNMGTLTLLAQVETEAVTEAAAPADTAAAQTAAPAAAAAVAAAQTSDTAVFALASLLAAAAAAYLAIKRRS
jgi:hypothetical protein